MIDAAPDALARLSQERPPAAKAVPLGRYLANRALHASSLRMVPAVEIQAPVEDVSTILTAPKLDRNRDGSLSPIVPIELSPVGVSPLLAAAPIPTLTPLFG
jgi:hypothetical protein